MPDRRGERPAPGPGARYDPAVVTDRLRRTWNAGAARINVTFGGDHGDQWDVEQSSSRVPAGR